MKKNKQEGYKFSDKTHPLPAVLSVVIGAAALIMLLFLIIRSGMMGGEGGLSFGTAGVIMLLLAMAGLIMAGLSFRKHEIHYVFPVIGVAMNSVLTILYVVIYIAGIMSV